MITQNYSQIARGMLQTTDELGKGVLVERYAHSIAQHYHSAWDKQLPRLVGPRGSLEELGIES